MKDQPNVDETGIHYGILQANLGFDHLVELIHSNGKNVNFDNHINDFKNRINHLLEDKENEDLIDYINSVLNEFDVDEISDIDDFDIDEAVGVISDNYLGENDTYRYENGRDIFIYNANTGYITIIESEFVTYARFCSPCYPNAGDLNSLEGGFVKTYCFDPDYFERYGPNGFEPNPYVTEDHEHNGKKFKLVSLKSDEES